MEKFEVVVIGSGPAGFAAAMRAFDFGKHVCIIEKNQIGGAGIMNGALTSKTMWELSCDYAVASAVDRGYRASGLHVDYAHVRKTVLQAAKDKQYQMLSQIETYSRIRSSEGSLTLKYGTAKFINNNTIEITSEENTENIEGDNFVIATGSRPREYTGIEIDEKTIITSDGILNLTKFPERIIIIGSGIVGCEFATIFSNFKQTEVHLLDRQHRVIPFEDDDLSDFVSKNLEKNGVIIHHTANLREMRKTKDCLQVILDYEDGHSKVIEVDVALVSIGRVPNIEGLGLENINISPNSKGFLNINDFCMVQDNPNKCHIYAAGDVTGHAQLYNVAELQGRFAIEGMYKHTVYPADYSTMSTLMFFKPEVAAVGMNEKMLQHKKISYKSAVYSNALVNRNIAMRSTRGFIKVLVSNDGLDRILGMRAVGPQASSFIVSIAHLINDGINLNQITKVIHPHPSVTEGIQECLRVFSSKSIYKPSAFPDLISLKVWNPEE